MAGHVGLPRVAIVIVSHSAQIADGVVELAGQMAPNVVFEPAGGRDDGGLGTDFQRICDALDGAIARVGAARAEEGSGVVVLCDLGSAILAAETARDLLDDGIRERVVIVDAPLVEGTVAAAVAAETGRDLASVRVAAESARGCATARGAAQAAPGTTAPGTTAPDAPPQDGATSYARTVTLINQDGLHARPAAEFVRLASTFPVRLQVNGKDAKSLLGIMSLGLLCGAQIEISAADQDGAAAVDALVRLVESGFGEGKPA